eukprot:23783_1
MASKKVIQEMFVSMGFQPNYIQRGFKVYEKNYGHSYNVEVITEIIIRLQNKDQVKLNRQREYEKQEIVPINTSKRMHNRNETEDDTVNNKSDAPANGNIEEKHHPVSHGTPRYKRKRRRAQKKRKKRKKRKSTKANAIGEQKHDVSASHNQHNDESQVTDEQKISTSSNVDNMNDHDTNEVIEDNPNLVSSSTTATMYNQLMAMGFDEERVNLALEITNDLSAAICIASNESQCVMSPKDHRARQFGKFLKRNNLETYADKFAEQSCNDLEFVDMFTDELLQNDIKMQNKFLRKRFLSKCVEMKDDMDRLKDECGISSVLYNRLAKYGLVTMNILCEEIKKQSDLKDKYQIDNDNQCNFVWQLIQKCENQNHDQVQAEGTPYI